MRGYMRVPLTRASLKWVPNVRPLGGTKWITHANYVLGWTPHRLWFEQRVQEYRKTNAILTDEDLQFRSALKSAAGQIGLPASQAAMLDRAGTGIIATRGRDPGGLKQADSVKGDGEE
jgi:hypothetical protein